jgi:hypothetical protein
LLTSKSSLEETRVLGIDIIHYGVNKDVVIRCIDMSDDSLVARCHIKEDDDVGLSQGHLELKR